MKVIEPTPAPRYEATLWRPSGVGWAMKEANEVVTAAIPTKAWKAATVCGSSVTATLYPIVVPTAEEIPNKAKA